MHEVEAKGILSAHNGVNIYRGCQHGCIYCDARSRCYQMRHAFEDIEVKKNAPELLEEALVRKRKKCVIATGAMSDPYIPLERKLRLTRRCLEIIERHGFGAAIQTKSAGILRDLDVLTAIRDRAKCVVQMTLTTWDEGVCRVVEPNVSTTRARFEALMAFRAAGIPTVVWLSPILPWINDTEENLRGVLAYCREAGVKGILCFGMGVTLREGDREYFYQKLDAHFPGLRRKYVERYGAAYEIRSPRHDRLMRVFTDFCAENGIEGRVDANFAYLSAWEEHGERTEQMRMF